MDSGLTALGGSPERFFNIRKEFATPALPVLCRNTTIRQASHATSPRQLSFIYAKQFHPF
jgi:hypothetical protein